MPDDALRHLETVAARHPDGYVALQTIPFRAHHLLLQEVLRTAPPGGRVFEAGVSSGYFAAAMVEAGLQVDGHELDPEVAESARAVCKTVVVGDLQALSAEELDGTYDVLLFGDTLEHVPDPTSVLRRLRARLADGGALIVSVPNIANWSIRLSLLTGRFRYTDRGILDRTHLRFFTARTLAELVEGAGYRVEKLQAAVPVPGVRRWGLARITHRLGNLLPGVFAYNLVVTARPA